MLPYMAFMQMASMLADSSSLSDLGSTGDLRK
jgi:hypothetical protein